MVKGVVKGVVRGGVKGVGKVEGWSVTVESGGQGMRGGLKFCQGVVCFGGLENFWSGVVSVWES